ncbi:MAG: UDP-N-acetylmuramate dehydrogenase [Cyanobacteria bacterium NC_groundwater_1444_Ag_S-0.65um_54_12]|nr:UDP-N-acetylmuramate dehydrogenase [Cyanobacteria bacterium NC_groundwater_1444_Ag_S-0.65um_54_12]
MPAVKSGYPLAPLVSWRVGGMADYYAEPSSADELFALIQQAKLTGLPWFLLGKGSNLLVADEGFRGIVIRMVDSYSGIKIAENQIIAQAGATNAAVVKAGMEVGLGGIEFLASIPGSVGGAVFMNAGAHGEQLADVLLAARILETDGTVHWRNPVELAMQYRHSLLQESKGIVLEAAFQVSNKPTAEIRQEILANGAWRRQHQPPGPSAGSTFRNPPGDSAGRLIESSGLKGFRIGGAMVSPVHANFIINSGNATASEINALICEIRHRVWALHGIWLQPEVRGLGIVVGEV